MPVGSRRALSREVQLTTVLSLFDAATSEASAALDVDDTEGSNVGVPLYAKPLERNELQLVEAILDKRIVEGTAEYLCRWFGMSENYDSWEPTEHIFSRAMLEDFERAWAKAGLDKDVPATDTVGPPLSPRRVKKVDRYVAMTAADEKKRRKACSDGANRGLERFGVWVERVEDPDSVPMKAEAEADSATGDDDIDIDDKGSSSDTDFKSKPRPASGRTPPPTRAAAAAAARARAVPSAERADITSKARPEKRAAAFPPAHRTRKAVRTDVSVGVSSQRPDSKTRHSGAPSGKQLIPMAAAASRRDDEIVEAVDYRVFGGRRHQYAVRRRGDSSTQKAVWVEKDRVPIKVISKFKSKRSAKIPAAGQAKPASATKGAAQGSKSAVKPKLMQQGGSTSTPSHYDIIGRRVVDDRPVYLIAKAGSAIGWRPEANLDAVLVKKYQLDQTKKVYDRMAPENGSTYSVDFIAGGPRTERNRTEYKVKWAGYHGDKALAWVSAKAISKDLIDEYNLSKRSK